MTFTAVQTVAASGPQISVAPEILFNFGPVPVTNSLLLGLVGYIVVLSIFFSTVTLIKRGSRSLFMYGVMWVYEMMFNTCESVLGSRERAKKLAPLAITMFVLILVNNWLGLLPIVGPITYNGMPMFRGFAADLNSTFALALITMVSVQIWAVKKHGFFGNIQRYVHNPLKDPLKFFEGFLEIIAEFSRTVALSMRLFGNILGGEVLLIVLSYLASYGAPIILPAFMALELFVGAVQAYVFFMLTIVFISIGIADHDLHPEYPDIETKPVASLTEADNG